MTKNSYLIRLHDQDDFVRNASDRTLVRVLRLYGLPKADANTVAASARKSDITHVNNGSGALLTITKRDDASGGHRRRRLALAFDSL